MAIVIEDIGVAGAYEKIAPGNTAKGITASNLTNTAGQQARAVILIGESNTVRFREDGTAPTAAEGLPLSAGNSRTIVGIENIKNWKCIDAVSGETGTVYLHVYF